MKNIKPLGWILIVVVVLLIIYLVSAKSEAKVLNRATGRLMASDSNGGGAQEYIVSCPGKEDKECKTWACVRWNVLKCKIGNIF